VQVINVLIVVSTVAFVFETTDSFSQDCHRNPPVRIDDAGELVKNERDCEFWGIVWLWTEGICVALFTIDFGVRCTAQCICGEFRKFSSDMMNWVDVVAVFPFYLNVIVQAICGETVSASGVATEICSVPDLRFVRVIRLARILRSAPEKYAKMGGVISEIVSSAAMGLIIPIYLMFLSMFVWASLVFYAEQPQQQNCRYPADDSGGPRCNFGGIETNSFREERVGSGECFIEDWDSSKASIGNTGCLTEYACKCACDAAAHLFASDNGYYLLDGATQKTDQNGKAYQVDGVNTPIVGQGSCSGEIQFQTREGLEWSSDMFAESKPGGINTAMWWVVVTFTTVGYGDMNPRTPTGQVLAVLTMVCGIFFLAMPLAVVGAAFTSAWNRQLAEHEQVLADRAEMELDDGLDAAAKISQQKMKSFNPPNPELELWKSLPEEAAARLNLLSYCSRMHGLANESLSKCPNSKVLDADGKATDEYEFIDDVRKSVEHFTHKIKAIEELLESDDSWRPPQIIKTVKYEGKDDVLVRTTLAWEGKTVPDDGEEEQE